MHPTSYALVSVQTGLCRKVSIGGRPILTAINKTAVSGSVPVMPLGLLGDEQADPSVHGGLDKAVYAYPTEHYPFWIEERTKQASLGFSSDLAWGSMGENLSVQGLLESQIWLGDLLQFEHCTLRVTQPREPCFKFNAAMGFNTAVKRMAETGFCGFYLAVDIPGHVEAGESFSVIAGPRRVTVRESIQAKMFKHLR